MFFKEWTADAALAGWKGLVRMICFSKNEDRAELFTQWMDFKWSEKVKVSSPAKRNFACAIFLFLLMNFARTLHFLQTLSKTWCVSQLFRRKLPQLHYLLQKRKEDPSVRTPPPLALESKLHWLASHHNNRLRHGLQTPNEALFH